MSVFGRKNKHDGPTLAEQLAAELAEEVHTVDAVRRQMSPGERLEFGGPTRCPNCGSLGFVESMNRQRGNCFNFCYTCRNRWVITSRAVDASLAYPVDVPRSRQPVTSNPWTIDGYVELEDDLQLEVTPAIDERATAVADFPIAAAEPRTTADEPLTA